MIGGHTAASGGSHNGKTIGALEVCLNSFVVATIAERIIMWYQEELKLSVGKNIKKQNLFDLPQNHAAHFQAFDAQQIDSLLTFIGEPQILWIPPAMRNTGTC